MMRRHIFTGLLILVSLAARSQAPDLSVFESHSYIIATDTMPYRFLRPKTLEKDKKYPLIIFLHGAAERGKDNELQLRYLTPLFLNKSTRDNFQSFVLVPQCKQGVYWGGVSKPLFALIDEAIKSNPVDTDRIYVMGLSMGGYAVWWLVNQFPKRFAAAVPICGGGDVHWAPNIKDVPIWAFHGARDGTVKPDESRKMIEAIKKAGGSPLYTEYPDAHHDVWFKVFKEPELMPWVFSKKLK